MYPPGSWAHWFQYVDWLFDGKDIIAACQTACADGIGGERNNHNADFLTFYRIKDFRGPRHGDSVSGQTVLNDVLFQDGK